MSWPRKIFLESTALFPLGPRFENVDLAGLIKLRDILHFELIVADVSWREYVRRREKEIRDCLNKITQCRNDLVKHGQSVADLDNAHQRAVDYSMALPGHFLGMAKNLEITILPLSANAPPSTAWVARSHPVISAA